MRDIEAKIEFFSLLRQLDKRGFAETKDGTKLRSFSEAVGYMHEANPAMGHIVWLHLDASFAQAKKEGLQPSILCDCGHLSEKREFDASTFGYGRMEVGGEEKYFCLDCCGLYDVLCLARGTKHALYLTGPYRAKEEGHEVFTDSVGNTVARRNPYLSNWPGTLKIGTYAKVGRHNIAGVRYDVWFAFNGYLWHGVQYGDFTQVCHCKRTKQTCDGRKEDRELIARAEASPLVVAAWEERNKP